MSSYSLCYPYPVHVHALFFITIRLNNLNFLIWELQILNVIKSQGCFGCIGGFVIPLSPTVDVQAENFVEQVPNADLQDWMRIDMLIKGWIIGTLCEEVLGQAVGLNTAADVWSARKNTFNKATMDRELTLRHHLK